MGIRDNRMVVLGRTRFQTGITLADTIANIVEQNGVLMPFDHQHTSQRTVTDARRRHEPTLWLIWPPTRICPHPCGQVPHRARLKPCWAHRQNNPVHAEGHDRGGMTELPLHRLHVRAGAHREARDGVAKIVNRHRATPDGLERSVKPAAMLHVDPCPGHVFSVPIDGNGGAEPECSGSGKLQRSTVTDRSPGR